MSTSYLSSLAILFYLISCSIQYGHIRNPLEVYPRKSMFVVAILAVLFHATSALIKISPLNGSDLSFFHMASLTFALITLITTLSSLTKPLENLLVGLFPLASVSVVGAMLFGDKGDTQLNEVPLALWSHISLSILAFSLFAIAACQAVFLAIQNYQLKHKHTLGIIQALPPLETMERLLFEIIWVGVLLLTLALFSGLFFIDDIFAQKLVHKIFFSVLAWFVFVALLVGRYWRGWHSGSAVHWTLVGCLSLVLAYFGSKFMIEILLPKG